MALFRCGSGPATENYVVFKFAHNTTDSGFFQADGTLIEHTGASASDKYGISYTYPGNDSYAITNNSGHDIVYSSLTGSNVYDTPVNGVIADGATATVLRPVAFIRQ